MTSLLGSSRALLWKEARGTISLAPPGIGIVGANAPLLIVGENPNNQGCCNKKALDGILVVQIENATSDPIRIDVSKTTFVVDSQSYAIANAHYRAAGEDRVVPFDVITIPPKSSGEVKIRAPALLPGSSLNTIDAADVSLRTTLGDIDVHFRPLKSVPVNSGGGYPALYE